MAAEDHQFVRTQRLLTGLALLQVNWSAESRSHLDNFIPFAAEAMAREGSATFTSATVKRAIGAEFGIDMPVPVVGNLLSRARSKGYVTVDGAGNWSLVAAAVDRLGFPREREAQFQREQKSLAASLGNYASSQFGLDWNEERALETLLEYVDANGSTLLTSAIRGGASREIADREVNADHVVVASWIDEVLRTDAARFEYLVSLVKGSMLATSLFLPGGLEVERPFVQTSLYLDTPLVLKALGFEGADQAAAVRDTLLLAKSQGAGLRVFDISVKEARNVLLTAAANIGRPLNEYSRAVDKNALDMGWSRVDVEIKAEALEDDLAKLGIEVRARPDHIAALTVDEVALDDLLDKNVRYSIFGGNARQHDVDALTAVYRRRGRAAGDRLELARAVLVTTNEAVVRTARKFDGFPSNEWPIAMLQQDVATILWAKKPMQAPELPRHQVAAACASILNPDASLWRKYIDEVERLAKRGAFSNEEANLLRYHQEARRALVKQTLGDADEVDTELVQKVLEEAQTAIRAPLEGQLDMLSADLAAKDAASEKAANELKDRLAAAEQRAAERERELDSVKGENASIIALERARSRRDGNIIRWSTGIVIGTILALGVFTDFGPVAKVAAALGAFGAYLGNLTLVGRHLGDFIAQKSFAYRMGRLGLAIESEGGTEANAGQAK